jgi:hypothetical protein
MIKRWFEFSSNGNGNGNAERHSEAGEKPVTAEERSIALPSPPTPPPPMRFGILKVVEMVNSQHLNGMSPDGKRCAVMMTLEAVGAGLEELLQDAVRRQRALLDEEQKRQDALGDFEKSKSEENANLQAELDSLTAQFVSRMQANVDEVAREQDAFRAWQRKKNQEAQHIADAAALCVPDGGNAHGGTLATVLERACAARKSA